MTPFHKVPRSCLAGRGNSLPEISNEALNAAVQFHVLSQEKISGQIRARA